MEVDSHYLENYEQFLERLPTRIHVCRARGHRFPDWDDHKRTHILKRKTGSFMVWGECLRKCGTIQYSFMDADGHFEKRTTNKLDYSANPDYLLPKNARSGVGLTKEMRAMSRAILLEKLSEWITEE